jgi:hypothetical protein
LKTSDPEFLAAIRELPCLACNCSIGVEAHHIKTRRNYGDDAWNVIPLCHDHHRGSKGWHGGMWTFLKVYPHIVEHLRQLEWTVWLDEEILVHPRYK